jgi:23S rRNA pseudouridine2605 synthase
MRINRFLASAGYGSRRGVEALVREGRVTVNGVICANLATEIAPGDTVKVDGRAIESQAPFYVLLNKPRGYISTSSDELGRRTVFELLPKEWPRLFHVGRLDKDSEGLLILTNDGEFALKLTHPRYKIEKEYVVTLDRPCETKHISELLRGVFIESGRARAERVIPIEGNALAVVLRQGLKRQVRLMFSTLGYNVKRLKRVRIGDLRISRVPLGGWRILSAKEVAALAAEGERPDHRAGKPGKQPAAGERQHPSQPGEKPFKPRRSGPGRKSKPSMPDASSKRPRSSKKFRTSKAPGRKFTD